MRAALALAALCACGKDKDDTGALPPPITLTSTATAKSAEVAMTSSDVSLIEAHRALAMTMDIVLSDNTVKSTLYTDGNLGSPGLTGYAPCWMVPFPGIGGFEYDVDLSGCSNEGFSGMIHVDNTAVGPLVFTFAATQILDWTFTGSLAFDHGLDRSWAVYNSDAASVAGPPITVDAPNGTTSLTLAGGFDLSQNGKEYSWWNASSDGAQTLGVGGPPAAESGTTVPPTVTTYTTMSAECRCETEGDLVLQTSIDVSTITVDLDDLIDGDDGVDDPEIPFAITSAPTGTLTLTRAEDCGRFDITFAPAGGTTTITLGASDLAAGFQAACDNSLVTDDGKCTRMQQAASKGSIEVTVKEEKLDDALTEWSKSTFDDGICLSGLETTTGGPGF
jgi:hypothetical protein